ncbi:hypothetical protein HOD20_00370 [archaeon]|jgi:hypothetical protein|nr:hypothetical protein [archaeon]MBT4350956.1 hypothetical protein [archaeon]MBT4646895.1 hypothetical protein [archaeon]MBT6822140.1 hypothetical protein [archaeon]MBT7392983.1 hypothetical protein [archaeon]
MAYIVITGNDRKEFEILKEAIEYKTGQSRIYEMDAFGNMRPLDNESLQKAMESEPKFKDNFVEEPEEKNESTNKNLDKTAESENAFSKIDETINPNLEKKTLVDLPDKKEVKDEIKKDDKPKSYKILRMIVLIIMIMVALFVVWSVIQPFMNELNNI